jgi:hypothetical protein
LARLGLGDATLSRAFAAFAQSQGHGRRRAALIRRGHGGYVVQHSAREATAIEARAKKPVKGIAPFNSKRKRGRSRTGEIVMKAQKRPKRPETMPLAQIPRVALRGRRPPA